MQLSSKILRSRCVCPGSSRAFEAAGGSEQLSGSEQRTSSSKLLLLGAMQLAAESDATTMVAAAERCKIISLALPSQVGDLIRVSVPTAKSCMVIKSATQYVIMALLPSRLQQTPRLPAPATWPRRSVAARWTPRSRRWSSRRPVWIYEGALLFVTGISCNYRDSPYKGGWRGSMAEGLRLSWPRTCCGRSASSRAPPGPRASPARITVRLLILPATRAVKSRTSGRGSSPARGPRRG